MLTVLGGWLVPAENLRRWFDARFPPGPHEIRDPYSSRGAALYTILYNRFGIGFEPGTDLADDFVCRTICVGRPPKDQTFVLVVVESGDFNAAPKDVRRCLLDPNKSERAQLVKDYLEGMGMGFEQNGVRWCQYPGAYHPRSTVRLNVEERQKCGECIE